MHRIRRSLVAAAVAFLAVLGLARADVVHLRRGKVEGEVLKQTKTEVVVRTNSGGTVTLKVSDVVRIERKSTPAQVYREMAAKVAADDADGHYSLGLWCTDHKLYRQAREEHGKAIAINPDHEGARTKLGYVRKGGKWLTRTEAKRADGFVRHDGEWVSKEERESAEHRAAVLAARRRVQLAIAKRPVTTATIAGRLRSLVGNPPSEPVQGAIRVVLRETARAALEAKRDRTIEARIALLEAVGTQKHADATALLRSVAVRDINPKVRQAAVAPLAAQKSVENTAYFVELLRRFTGDRVRVRGSRKTRMMARRVLRRAADALKGLGDRRAIPALANAMVVRFHIAEKAGGDLPPMSIGLTSGASVGDAIVTDGMGNQYATPVSESSNWGLEGDLTSRDSGDDPFFFNDAAYNALRDLTRQDFSHDKQAWLAWWYRNRHNLED